MGDAVSPAHLRRRGLGGRPTVAKQKIKGGWGASPAAALLLTALAEAVRAVLNIDYTEAAELGAVWAQKKPHRFLRRANRSPKGPQQYTRPQHQDLANPTLRPCCG